MEPTRSSDAAPNVPTGANPGYALGQLARALTAIESQTDGNVLARAVRKVERWTQVIRGLLTGSLRPGSRVPVAGAPAWATLEVVTGGFATGALLAAGPLQSHERELLTRLPSVEPGTERAALNAYFLSEAGLAELGRMLASGGYRVNVPEEGALLVVAWLVTHGHAARARTLLEEIGPHFSQLRFYPVPEEYPPTFGAVTHLQDVGATVAQLESIQPNQRVERQREAVGVWQPLYDRVVALFAETVEGPLPTLYVSPDGKTRVEGGWPCQQYAAGWPERARAVLADFKRLRAVHTLCKGPDSRKDGFATLRRYLEQCVERPESLSGRDVGRIRAVLAGLITRRGAPGSERTAERSVLQARQTSAPGRHLLARILVGRLARVPHEEGLASLDEALAPVREDEARALAVPVGTAIPPGLARRVRRALDAPLSFLVEEGIIPSAETLARVVPQITAQVRATGLETPELRRLYAAVYAAFRRRRSLLLLNLQSQVKLDELPWVRAVNGFRTEGDDTRLPARLVLEELTIAALTGFPQQILPNKLLQEIRALTTGAGLNVPIVDEVAADIFMGTFSEKFLRAAQAAAEVLDGTLYERYYGISFDQIRAIDDVTPSGWGAPVSPAFAALCVERAGPSGPGSAVARNGTIIEQEQVLTTHNLAPLFAALELGERLRAHLEALASRAFDWICRRLRQTRGYGRSELRAAKNAAYAWRQAVFFLSVAPEGAIDSFLAGARARLAREPDAFRKRLEPALAGLARAARGQPVEAPVSDEEPHGARRVLGWTTGKHWLLD
ncbi:hypothetical protein [Frigoriglobus tundricola]|uniref:Uncharacterized protein n=1 Tax=Frigoriglobus tundricola TaxID=2774151 RepID=A0A6M5Z656_9BACT|nr:hypothetical protein [Frigoriglobus tundricola]QJX00713.1 hypothetical protein FTUN_8345 [Frigoriglobus tundricola]